MTAKFAVDVAADNIKSAASKGRTRNKQQGIDCGREILEYIFMITDSNIGNNVLNNISTDNTK